MILMPEIRRPELLRDALQGSEPKAAWASKPASAAEAAS